MAKRKRCQHVKKKRGQKAKSRTLTQYAGGVGLLIDALTDQPDRQDERKRLIQHLEQVKVLLQLEALGLIIARLESSGIAATVTPLGARLYARAKEHHAAGMSQSMAFYRAVLDFHDHLTRPARLH